MSLLNKAVECKYNELIAYTKFMLNVSRKHIEYEVVISNAFILASKHDPKTIDEAKGILFHYIKAECLYSRTASQKEIITAVEYSQEIDKEDASPIIDLHDIIDQEVNSWNFIDRGFFEKYMTLKRQNENVKALAKEYSIDYTYTRKKINELKKKIRCKI